MNQNTSAPRPGASHYDSIAEWYDTWVGPDSGDGDPYVAATVALIGDFAGQRVCDLACGQGRVARYLADRSARVVGVDISAKLLAIAQRAEDAQPRGIAYLQADAQHLDAIADQVFEGVLCHMALMDIPELAPTLRSVERILRPGGWFVFSILHPCYNSAPSGEQDTPTGVVRLVSGYFTEGYWRSDARTGPPGKVGSYHRTLATYVNLLSDAGFIVGQIAEPRATGVHATRRPVWAEVPAVLIVRCQEPEGDSRSGRSDPDEPRDEL